ncbi:hypothetical protein R3P38DRAFT_2410931, partial [Favolaschia claudopus]
SVILVNSSIPSDSFVQLPFPSHDVVALIFPTIKLLLLGIYNDGTHNNTLTALHTFFSTYNSFSRVHIITLGDFNRHHVL